MGANPAFSPEAPASPATTPARTLIVAAFAALYILWGSTYLGVKIGMESFPPYLLGGMRFMVAGVLLGGWLLATRRVGFDAFTNLRWWRNATVAGALFFTVANGMVGLGVQRIPSGLAALIVALTSVWIVLLDRLVTRQGAPPWSIMLGMAAGVAGVAVLDGHLTGQGDDLDMTGVLIVTGSTFAWAIGTVVSKHAQRAPSLLATSAMQMVAGGALMFVVSALCERAQWPAPAEIKPAAVAAVIYLVVCGSLLGFTAYVFLLQHINAAAVATYAYVNPLVALAVGWLLAGELVPARTWIAAPLILGAVALMQGIRPPSRDQMPVEEE